MATNSRAYLLCRLKAYGVRTRTEIEGKKYRIWPHHPTKTLIRPCCDPANIANLIAFVWHFTFQSLAVLAQNNVLHSRWHTTLAVCSNRLTSLSSQDPWFLWFLQIGCLIYQSLYHTAHLTLFHNSLHGPSKIVNPKARLTSMVVQTSYIRRHVMILPCCNDLEPIQMSIEAMIFILSCWFFLSQFLEKMLADRTENVEAVQKIAAQIHDQTDAEERQQVNNEVADLMNRWSGLKNKVSDRSKALDDNLGMCDEWFMQHRE